MKSKISEIAQKIKPLLIEYRVEKAALFGSFARGEGTNQSDIDILVKTPRSLGLFGFIKLNQQLAKKLGKSVDLVEYSTIKNSIKESILAQQIILYEKQ